MNAPEDVQDPELEEIPPPLPLESTPPVSDDEEAMWNALEDLALPSEDDIELPVGCPDTPMHRHSYKVLQEARKEASEDKERKYSSQVTRLRMEAGISSCANGMVPRFYQEDCAEAFLLGVDTGLICATGSGKTEAFILALFVEAKQTSKIIVVSTLKSLQYDQVTFLLLYMRSICMSLD